MAEKKLSDFPEEFMMAWELAKEGKLSLSFDTRGKAVNFRHRLYGFRSLYRKELGAAGTVYDTIELSVEQKNDSLWILSTKPSAWKEQIRALKAQADSATAQESASHE
jgi:hypothetical protein